MLNRGSLLFTILFAIILCDVTYSQGGDYQIANQLMQQQRYEDALPILEELHQNNPSAHVFFDRYVECLINLNRMDEAEQVARRQIQNGNSPSITRIRLAEIQHINGNQEEAVSNWNRALEENSGNIQTYYSVASSMNKRREFNLAVDVYTQAQTELNNPTLFLNELAATYLQAGRFEESVREYYRLVVESPDQMGLVQQRFLQMRDDELFQIASFELEDLLFELTPSHEAYPQLYQLLTWLLLETEEFRRAYNFALYYENETEYTVQSLMILGSQFLSAGQFSYAAEAFRYYVDNAGGSNRFRAMEELAKTYQMWSQYLQQHNLENDQRHRELYQQAYDMGNELLDDAPSYNRADVIFALMIDLSLDEFKDIEKATFWYEQMRNHTSADEAYTLYAEGRIALFNKNYTRARQALTRADRATENSNLSEQSRYYLSLSDFFAGDYEFADIQLRSLERRQTSYYANDTIKLRMWIKNGQRADTTGSILKALGEGLFEIHSGRYEHALPYFEPLLANTNNPFADEVIVELSSVLPSVYDGVILALLNRQIQGQPHSPLLERLMWDRAVLTEKLVENEAPLSNQETIYQFSFLNRDEPFDHTPEDVANLYEEIILEFPDGFYALYAREKLQRLEQNYL